VGFEQQFDLTTQSLVAAAGPREEARAGLRPRPQRGVKKLLDLLQALGRHDTRRRA
jgi:hypothetical protein